MPKLLIGQYQTGVQKNIEPMWLPNEAYETLEDAFVWRGRTRRKQGYDLLGRLNDYGASPLPLAAGNIATGAFTFAGAPFAAGDLPLMPGSVAISITVGVPLWPAAITFVDNGNGTLTASNAAIAGGFTLAYGIIDYVQGTFNLYIDPVMPAGGPFAVAVTAFRHLPQFSAMGLGLYETNNVAQEGLIAFDEDFSYLYNTATGVFDPLRDVSAGNPVKQWTGTNSDFFWTVNYYRDNAFNKLFWATNNVANIGNAPALIQNGIQIYNGTWWYGQTPQVDAAANQLRGCLMLIPYRGRMVALNTLEGAASPAGANRYPNRARWSQNGVPYTTTLGGLDATSWRSDIVGKGGYIDAPTKEAIVSAAFIKDTLVVFFERSTWLLRYTGEVLPFIWEHVDSELGSESTFSSVVFDKGVLAVGDKGLIAASTLSVERIDSKIPDLIFEIQNDNNGSMRVHGIRDFFTKMAYWCYADQEANGIFPNRVLAFNYDDQCFSTFNDTFTCFGTWQSTSDYTWATLPYTSWSSWDIPWGSPMLQSYFPSIIAGNHKGFVEILNRSSENDPYADLQVSVAIPNTISNGNPAVCQILNHNLQSGQFIKIYFTRGFGINIVGELSGTAQVGATSFTGILLNEGVFPASGPVAGGPPYVSIQVGANTFTDLGNGTLRGGVGNGTIDYELGKFTVNFAALAVATPVVANYTYNVLNNRVFYIERITANTFELYTIDPVTNLTVAVDLSAFANYTGWGAIAQIYGFSMRTKRFNPFLEQGAALTLSYFDMLVEDSEMTFSVNVFADDDGNDPIQSFYVSCFDETGSGLAKNKNWKRVYVNSVSDFIQMEFTLTNYQMTREENYSSDLIIYTMLLDTDKAGRNINRS